MCPYRFSDDGIISSYFEASLMQFMYCRNAAYFWLEKSRLELLFLGRLIPKRRRKNKPFCIWSTSSLWQSVLSIVKQYKCIVVLLYYSGHITIIITLLKHKEYVCFEKINESVIYKTPYHQNKIRMLIIPTYIRAWGQLT